MVLLTSGNNGNTLSAAASSCHVAIHRNEQSQQQAIKIICQGTVKDGVELEFGDISWMSKTGKSYHDSNQDIVVVDKIVNNNGDDSNEIDTSTLVATTNER